MAEELNALRIKRATTKGAITRINNFINLKKDVLPEELECRLSLLEAYFKQYLSLQDIISALDNSEAETTYCSEMEDTYCQIKAKILAALEQHRKRNSISLPADQSMQSTSQIVVSSSKATLPKLQLPQFSGKYTEYTNFINTFKLVVDGDENLSGIEKLLYLRSYLQGEAFNAIQSLEVNETNYAEALKLLEARYNNKYLIFQTHIQQLLNAPEAHKASSSQLRSVADTINVHLKALESLGDHKMILNSLLFRIVKSKIDSVSVAKWEESIDHKTIPTWEAMNLFLQKRCQYLDTQQVIDAPHASSSRHGSNKPRTSLISTNLGCMTCNSREHMMYQCPSFLRLSIGERFQRVKEFQLCINCLRKGHGVKECRASKCRTCHKSHHTLLHRVVNSSGQLAQESHPSPNLDWPRSSDSSPISHPHNHQSHSAALLSSTKDNIVLATANILVKDKFGNFTPARALLDSASQLNFITEALANKLKLKKKLISGQITGIGKTNSTVLHATQIAFKSINNNYQSHIEAWILPVITSSQPETDIDISTWKIPANLCLADPQFEQSRKVDMLLGADEFYKLLAVGQIRLGPCLPIIQKTLLGWIIAGKHQSTTTHNQNSYVSYNHEVEPLSDLSQEIERFWSVEEIHSHTSKWTHEHKLCEEHFQKTWNRDATGRFVLELPFKQHKVLGTSYMAARSSLLRLEHKFSRNPNLKAQYSEFLQEYETLGHMQKWHGDISSIKYFIPHHCVLRPDSSSTKLRVVFNASCPTSNGTSLNDILMVGPTVQEDLFNTAIRFRGFRYAITADITKMYRQILVTPNHCEYLGILWRDSPTAEISAYVLKTVTYGTASAPFQATRCLTLLADTYSKKYPRGSQAIKTNMYVDDLLTGEDNLQAMTSLKFEIESILKLGKFELRKWCSSNKNFITTIPEGGRGTPLEINESKFIKALGIIWEPNSDTIQFSQVFTLSSRHITKRQMLSKIASLYDPLGLINPIIVTAKILMQEIWKLKLNWDESLPLNIHQDWITFQDQFSQLSDIKIPRYINLHHTLDCELHGFSDASSRAYGCCIYLKSVNASGEITVRLIAAKSRVAPLKLLTIPRLELCAALLLAQLIKIVSSVWPGLNIYLWSDSEIVLHWIAADPSTWTTFVANRVNQIQEITSSMQWRHVPSPSNPADIISRGSTVPDLLKSIWFEGPEFLKHSLENWPVWNRTESSSNLPEKRKDKITLTVSPTLFTDLISHHKYINNFPKLRRIFGYIIQFIRKLKSAVLKQDSQISNLELSPSELHNAFMIMIYHIQQLYFAKDLQALRNGQCISSRSPLKSLNPFLDPTHPGILRVGGRLGNTKLPYEVKHPAVLPRNHPLTFSYFTYLHKKLMHIGPQALVATSRETVWCLNAKQIASRVVHQCIHCFHYRPKLQKQIMGQLPSGRVQAIRPFHTTGVDYCGPFQTTVRRRGSRYIKSYIALFICFASKAVHLEVVSDLSSDAFIAALKRFVARRGLCTRIYSDNGTNFVGASNKLKELYTCFTSQQEKAKITSACQDEGITFSFIPPRAPHFGGLWEAAVKSAKHHLYRILHNTSLTFEEFSTLACEVEAILNSRPITPLSTDPSDEQALTPGHLLIGEPLKSIPEPHIQNYSGNLSNRWRLLTELKHHFWSRWSREYVPQLQQRYKWTGSSPDLKPNTLVLLADNQQPPQSWLLGRILESTVGPDNHVRVVKVKTQDGVKTRAIHTLAPLPMEDTH